MEPTLTPQLNTPSRWQWRRWTLVVAGIVVLGLAAFTINRMASATITVVSRLTGHNGDTTVAPAGQPSIADDPEYAMPSKDSSRLDILLLGMRGKDDVANGGLLTDTILLLSINTKTDQAVITAIPRDLTVRVTNDKTEKINTAYIHNGLDGTKRLYSRILGVSIDNIAVFDFDAFKYVVNTLGGITVTLDKPFTEKAQWGYEFSLPAGVNNLDGDQALYYARSRYSSSDFDRSRRQMQVIMAIKAKATALQLTQDPLKALQLITAIRKHMETDLSIFDIGTLKDLITQGNKLDKIKRYQFTTENILYETKVDGIYELLPRDNTLAHIKEFMKTIFDANPVLPTPEPGGTTHTPTFTAPATPTPTSTP